MEAEAHAGRAGEETREALRAECWVHRCEHKCIVFSYVNVSNEKLVMWEGMPGVCLIQHKGIVSEKAVRHHIFHQS